MNLLKGLLIFALGLLVGLVAPKAIEIQQAIQQMDANQAEHFCAQSDGTRHTLTGYINGAPATAPEEYKEQFLVVNNDSTRCWLKVYKFFSADCKVAIVDSVRSYALLTGGLYEVVSQPHDSTEQAQVCLINVSRRLADGSLQHFDL